MRVGRLALMLAAMFLTAAPCTAGTTSSSLAPKGPEAEAIQRPARRAPPSPDASAPPPQNSRCAHERDLSIDPKAQTLHVGLKTYPQTLKLDDKEVVLTFDDGPDPETTPKVLAALKEACIHATFFLIGRHAAQYPVLVRREQNEHHTLGHHSYTHPPFTLRGYDAKSAEEDIEHGIEADDKALFPDAQDKPSDRPRVPFFRFPGFADTPELKAYLDRRHIAVFGADLWAADWLKMTPDHERSRVLDLLEGAKHHNGILLLHDTRPSTAAMLPDLLWDLKARGYTFVHLRYDPGAPKAPLESAPEGWTSETERIISRLRVRIVPGTHHLGALPETPSADVHDWEEMPR